MTKKIIAITFIFICTSVAWVILGATIFARTYDSGAISSNRVASTWGTQQKQALASRCTLKTSRDAIYAGVALSYRRAFR